MYGHFGRAARMKQLLFLSLLCLWVSCTSVFAQNWRTPNPNQPNGYRATSAAYHYSGSYKEPAQPSNGYRASEARSHVGMNSFAPPTSSEKSGGGRWGESRGGGGGGRWGGSEGGGWGGSEGGRFGGSEGGRFGGGEDRRWGNATGSSFQSGGQMPNRQEEWNEFYKRRFEATEQGGYNNAVQGNPQQQFAYGQGAAIGANFGGYSQPGQSFDSTQAMRAAIGASAVRRMLRNGDDGNFNRVYSSNSGGFNRIYAGQQP